MKPRSSFTARRLLVAATAALLPAGAAISADPCAGDPFAPYQKSFRSDGPEYECTAALPPDGGIQGRSAPEIVPDEPAGARGPAGPTLEAMPLQDDPVARYHRVFTAD